MSGNSEAMEMLQMITGGLWLTSAIYAAAKLGIADLLNDGPKTTAELAQQAGAHPESLYRVLRALSSRGIFAEDGTGRFGLTVKARLLTSGAGSLRATAIAIGEPWHYQVWASFMHTVRTGETTWNHATGQGVFEYFSSHPDRARMFDEMMTEFSALEGPAILKAYDFSGFHTVADIAGGHGLLLANILERYPAIRGILFDLPHVTAGAHRFLTGHGISQRCEIIPGDMFHFVPGGADGYLLKNILHDWDDEHSVRVLSNIRRAMGPHSRILVLQEALPPGNAPSAGKMQDLQMLLIGGRERTPAEYESLFYAAGLRLARIIPTDVPIHIIEGVLSDAGDPCFR
ncbi:MAG: methyltransferase [Bryobacteraceae bacterium]|nr:methyltransferase [Bryobacteraceae bacterium]